MEDNVQVFINVRVDKVGKVIDVNNIKEKMLRYPRLIMYFLCVFTINKTHNLSKKEQTYIYIYRKKISRKNDELCYIS